MQWIFLLFCRVRLMFAVGHAMLHFPVISSIHVFRWKKACPLQLVYQKIISNRQLKHVHVLYRHWHVCSHILLHFSQFIEKLLKCNDQKTYACIYFFYQKTYFYKYMKKKNWFNSRQHFEVDLTLCSLLIIVINLWYCNNLKYIKGTCIFSYINLLT